MNLSTRSIAHNPSGSNATNPTIAHSGVGDNRSIIIPNTTQFSSHIIRCVQTLVNIGSAFRGGKAGFNFS